MKTTTAVTFDDRLSEQIQQAEARERDARAAELRLAALDLPPGSVKPRAYGELPRVEGLTALHLLGQRDPGLALLLGVTPPRPNYEQAAADEARQQQIQRLQDATAATRTQNQQAQQHRERAALAGVSLLTNRMLGQ